MGKSNKERAGQVIERIIKYVNWGSNYKEIETPIVIALDKAEKRGRRKERRKATSEVCIYCPGLKKGECPHVNANIPALADKPPFDAEKVKGLLQQMYGHTKYIWQFDTLTNSAWAKFQGVYNRLERELGIDKDNNDSDTDP